MLVVLIFIASILGLALITVVVLIHRLHSLGGKLSRLRKNGADIEESLGKIGELLSVLNSDIANLKLVLQAQSGETQVSRAELKAAVSDLADHTRRIAVFSEGRDKAALALVESVTLLEGSVSQFIRHAFGVEGSAPRETTFADMAIQNKVERLMQAGMTRDEALQTVRGNAMGQEVPE